MVESFDIVCTKQLYKRVAQFALPVTAIVKAAKLLFVDGDQQLVELVVKFLDLMHQLDVQSINLRVHTDELGFHLSEPGVHVASQTPNLGSHLHTIQTIKTQD